jgi:S-adenosylmethionine uptake transporter
MTARARSSIAIPFAVACLGIASFSVMDAVMKHLVLALGTYNALVWRTGAVAVMSGALFFALRAPWPGGRRRCAST